MKLNELVPIIDLDDHNPVSQLEACAEILRDEGWTKTQINQWAIATFALQPSALEVQLGGPV